MPIPATLAEAEYDSHLPQEARDVISVGKPTGHWDHMDLTVAIDGPMDAGSAATIRQAISIFDSSYPGAKLGLKLAEVAPGAAADIRLSLGSLTGGALGRTVSTSHSGTKPSFLPGTKVTIEDPASHAIDPSTNYYPGIGGYYHGTTATQLQVVMREIGHAIGLGDSADRWSPMDSTASYRNDMHNGTIDKTLASPSKPILCRRCSSVASDREAS